MTHRRSRSVMFWVAAVIVAASTISPVQAGRHSQRDSATGVDPTAVADECIRAMTELADFQIAQNAQTADECVVRIEQLLAAGQVVEARQVGLECIALIRADTRTAIRDLKGLFKRCRKDLKRLDARDQERRVKAVYKDKRKALKRSSHDAVAAIRQIMPDDDPTA